MCPSTKANFVIGCTDQGMCHCATETQAEDDKTGELEMARMDMSMMDRAEISAGGNSASALLELGIIFSIGRDVAIDLVSAHKWFNLAAMRGLKEARQYRQEIADEMSSTEIAQAQRQARDWLSMH